MDPTKPSIKKTECIIDGIYSTLAQHMHDTKVRDATILHNITTKNEFDVTFVCKANN